MSVHVASHDSIGMQMNLTIITQKFNCVLPPLKIPHALKKAAIIEGVYGSHFY